MDECRKEKREKTRITSTSQRLGLKCEGYDLKANVRYFSKSISPAQQGREHRAKVGTWEVRVGAGCGKP